MSGIFLSHRREDSSGYARLLHDRLVQRFVTEPIFMDVDSLQPGVAFSDVIHQTLTSCTVLIAVIGKHWLAAADEQGRRRIEQPGDFVRQEITTGLARKIIVIPVLVGGARMPQPEDLPPDLAKLTERQAIELTDTTFNAGVTKLLDTIATTITPSSRPSRRAPVAAFLGLGIAVIAGLITFGVPWQHSSEPPTGTPSQQGRASSRARKSRYGQYR